MIRVAESVNLTPIVRVPTIRPEITGNYLNQGVMSIPPTALVKRRSNPW
jgi:hypothetical protein